MKESEVKFMEKVIMPEIMTPAVAEAIASNPDIFNSIFGSQSCEEVIMGRDCELNDNDLNKKLKFIFCNVSIKINGQCDDKCEAHDCENKPLAPYSKNVSNIINALRINNSLLDKKIAQVEEMSREVRMLEDEVLALETRAKESGRILKIIIGQLLNRKLTYKFKNDINSLVSRLKCKKKSLAESKLKLEQQLSSKRWLEEESKRLMEQLYKIL
jgi:hypothetical protein